MNNRSNAEALISLTTSGVFREHVGESGNLWDSTASDLHEKKREVVETPKTGEEKETTREESFHDRNKWANSQPSKSL